MKFNRCLGKISTIIFLSILSVAPAAIAEPALLVGYTPGSRINVRSGPSTAHAVAHYGLVGDRVQTIDWVVGNDNYYWYYVEFSSGARGWIRGDFIAVYHD